VAEQKAQGGQEIRGPVAAREHWRRRSGLAENTTVSVLVHKFPSVARTTEVHLVHAKDSVALRPMTLEEAIKEAHFPRQRCFRIPRSLRQIVVLHRTRDGKMELIEAP